MRQISQHPKKLLLFDLDEYATMTEVDVGCNPQVEQHHSTDEHLKEGLLEEVNADASMPDADDDEYNSGKSRGNCRARDLEGNSNEHTFGGLKTDLTCTVQGTQIARAIDNRPCPYAASYHCELSFSTDGMALLHGAMHLAVKGKRPCPYAIQLKCALVFPKDSEALRHGKGHTKERSRNCPGCRKRNIPKDQILAHWCYCKEREYVNGEREGARWVNLAREPDLIEWELERAYYSQESEEWKVDNGNRDEAVFEHGLQE
jgi:hypothetical protein